ncbi:uncharacterized protein [Temnothorax nylanderi]|uniref:uncharacterized protein isoform X2 n=1 Tax=Temnothorax nylanderi TaxID=102681 RepID=UPI003A86DBD6
MCVCMCVSVTSAISDNGSTERSWTDLWIVNEVEGGSAHGRGRRGEFRDPLRQLVEISADANKAVRSSPTTAVTAQSAPRTLCMRSGLYQGSTQGYNLQLRCCASASKCHARIQLYSRYVSYQSYTSL